MLQDYRDYYNDNPHGYWFKNKLYGWGWTPVKWQGWITILLYLVSLFIITFFTSANQNEQPSIWFLPALALITAILLTVCVIKGEKPRWQWGLPKKDDKKE